MASLTVKPLSERRWEIRIDALKPLHYELGKVYDALIEIAEDVNLTGSSGTPSHVETQALTIFF